MLLATHHEAPSTAASGSSSTHARPKRDSWSPWSTDNDSQQWAGENELVSAEVIENATKAADALGIDHCFKDGIDVAIPPPSSEEEDVKSWDKVGLSGDESTDVETELGGIRRPQRGEGHWGKGPPLRIPRKGTHRDFVDGAGLCSPGR